MVKQAGGTQETHQGWNRFGAQTLKTIAMVRKRDDRGVGKGREEGLRTESVRERLPLAPQALTLLLLQFKAKNTDHVIFLLGTNPPAPPLILSKNPVGYNGSHALCDQLNRDSGEIAAFQEIGNEHRSNFSSPSIGSLPSCPWVTQGWGALRVAGF